MQYVYQICVAFSATLFMLSTAIGFGWTSPALPKLLSADSPINPITPDESSWIVSLMTIGTIIGPIPTAWMMDKIGRKTTLILGAIPLTMGWILVAVSESVKSLYTSRLLCGFAYGLSYTVLPVYLAEIASNRIRGFLTILLTVMAKLGILYAYAVGPYVSVRLMPWFAMIPVILFLLSFVWLPESPYFYLGQSRSGEALKSLSKLRNLPADNAAVNLELEVMDAAVQKAQENKGTFNDLFMQSGNRNGLIIILVLGMTLQLSGSQAIIAYSQQIFEKVGSGMDASVATIIIGVIQVLTAAVSSTIVDVVGRRPLLLTSVIGAAVCNTVVAIYFNLERHTIDTNYINWLPLAAIMAFFVFYTIGMSPVNYVLVGELFPKNLRAVASAAYTINSFTFGFVVTKLFQVVSDGLGSDYTFFGCAAFTYLAVPFIWFRVPETKGKSFDVILNEMNSPVRGS